MQRALWGRELNGQPDQRIGAERVCCDVRDAALFAASGRAGHAIVHFNGRAVGGIAGTARALAAALERADRPPTHQP